MDKSKLHANKKNKWVKYYLYFISILLLSISLRIFIIEIFHIPSKSMEGTLIPGDLIISEKISFGPRLPSNPFEIPWINIAIYLNKNCRVKMDSIWWNYKRIKGINKIQQNDIVLFNLPYNDNTVIIKRCLGLPGDTVYIFNTKVYINQTPHILPSKIKKTYHLYFKENFNNWSFLDENGIKISKKNLRFDNHISISITDEQKRIISEEDICDSIIINIQQVDSIPSVYPREKQLPWTFDNYGPVIVPKKGLSIALNPHTFLLYNKLINHYEECNITYDYNTFYIDGQEAVSYKFKNDYFWMMGDNRNSSHDSRRWGFVPERNIIGKAWVVLISKNYDGFKWDRVFKRIR